MREYSLPNFACIFLTVMKSIEKERSYVKMYHTQGRNFHQPEIWPATSSSSREMETTDIIIIEAVVVIFAVLVASCVFFLFFSQTPLAVLSCLPPIFVATVTNKSPPPSSTPQIDASNHFLFLFLLCVLRAETGTQKHRLEMEDQKKECLSLPIFVGEN